MDKDLKLGIAAYQSMYKQSEEVEEIDEESGDGYIGPARLGIKNPLASDATRAAADQRRRQQASAAARSGQRPTLGGSGSYANQFDAMRAELKNSYEPEGEEIDEAMSSYERNRKRAAQRAAERNAARDRGQTGNVPGVGYVSPRRERETWTDERGQERHKSGARMPKKEDRDLFDTILDYLISEGYADTNESALVIMSNMSEEWRQEILEAFVDPEHGEAPSGRSPLQNVSDHPKASVRKKAVKGFKKQMGKEYGGKWKSRTDDPTG